MNIPNINFTLELQIIEQISMWNEFNLNIVDKLLTKIPNKIFKNKIQFNYF